MSVKKLDQRALDSWVDGLIAKQPVIGVKAKGDKFAFGPLDEASQLRLDYDVTLLSPKKVLTPPVETLARFDRSQEQYESVMDDSPFVLLGVHPYDFVAIAQMDQVFSKGQYDAHYMARRSNCTVVVSDVQNASKNVFAGCMGTATVEDGFDVLVTRTDDGYVVDARTDKGEALLEGIDAADATEADLAAREKVWEQNKQNLRRHELKCAPTELPKLLEGAEDHPVWEERAELCYSCGSCVLTCPTCYCFDVRDDVEWNMEEGARRRTWDGCMLQEFALVAGGHNFRPNKTERYRHRFYRKGKYLWDRMGHIACIGCGRCITACTANIANPVENFNRILEDKQ